MGWEIIEGVIWLNPTTRNQLRNRCPSLPAKRAAGKSADLVFYVYELIDPRDGSVFYVGKGKRGRVDQHEVEARKGRQSRKCECIRAIESAGLKIKKRKAAHYTDEIEAYEAEIALIQSHGLANLTNVTSGGGGKCVGPTTYEDRIHAIAACKTLRQITTLRKNGVTSLAWGDMLRIDVAWVEELLENSFNKLAARRSLAWLNDVVAGQNVEFLPEQV